MTPPRKHLSKEMKIAAATAMIPIVRNDGTPVLDGYGRLTYRHSIDTLRTMTAAEFNSRFDWDHAIYHTWQGPHAYWNYTPMLRAEHRAKTAKRDAGEIAKVRRGLNKRKKIAEAIAAQADEMPAKPKKAKRAWPKQKMGKGRSFKEQREYHSGHRRA